MTLGPLSTLYDPHWSNNGGAPDRKEVSSRPIRWYPLRNGKEPLPVYLDTFEARPADRLRRSACFPPFYFMSLDLPRQIVNQAIQGEAFRDGNPTAPFLHLSYDLPAWLGGGTLELFEGFQVGRLGLLLGLSTLFLFFVIVNGAFKYWINVAKGILGERMLRRMRFDLFSMVLRFTPEALRTVKSSETATIVKDEVEPIGGFIGDAFITPIFLGIQAITALVFIMVQNAWLGLIALAVIAMQFTIIPRLRRALLRLGKQRQLASRELAGRIAEVLDGIEVVHVHNAYNWGRAEIGHRLFNLFIIRLEIYNPEILRQIPQQFPGAADAILLLRDRRLLRPSRHPRYRPARRRHRSLSRVAAAPEGADRLGSAASRRSGEVRSGHPAFFRRETGALLEVRETAEGDQPLIGPLVAEDIQVAGPHGDMIIEAGFRDRAAGQRGADLAGGRRRQHHRADHRPTKPGVQRQDPDRRA